MFATQYKKPKQARHLRDYVELKQNSDALVRKQQGQSFVGEVSGLILSVAMIKIGILRIWRSGTHGQHWR